MWEFGNSSTHAMVHEIHVLLVDHDAETLFHTANQLQICQCKVSYIDVTHVAISMLLSQEQMKFDVVMVNINANDPNGYILLQHALKMCIPVVCMSDDESTNTAIRALENGAFICINNPPSMEFLKSLWQHVRWEKTRMLRERDMLFASNYLGQPVRGVGFWDVVHPNPNPNFMVKNKGKCRTNVSDNGIARGKMCTEWTQELHDKFVDVVHQLGEGNCFPKDILELMNEPGLTRMQVASHLQKCRNFSWRSPEERKNGQQSLALTIVRTRTQSELRGLGAMPIFDRPSSSHSIMNMGQSSKTQLETRTPNDGVKMVNGSSSTTTNIAPQNYGINNYFKFSDMNNLIHDFTGRQQEPEINDPTPTLEGYQVHPAYNEGQNIDDASKSH